MRGLSHYTVNSIEVYRDTNVCIYINSLICGLIHFFVVTQAVDLSSSVKLNHNGFPNLNGSTSSIHFVLRYHSM